MEGGGPIWLDWKIVGEGDRGCSANRKGENRDSKPLNYVVYFKLHLLT